MTPLAVGGTTRFGADELSALCLRPGGDLLAVSDSAFEILTGATAPLQAGGRSPDLREAVTPWSHKPHKGSQWEGVAVDGAGFAFVLQEHAGKEHPSHVFVFAPPLDALVAVVELQVAEGDSRWRREWREDPNARGEALVLLAGGRLLVAKQKDPIRLIEFAPRGSPSLGLGPAQLAGPGADAGFAPGEPPRTLAYEAVEAWGVDEGANEPLESVNDATVADGALYLLSRSSRRIARVRLDDGAGSVRVEQTWTLPEEIENPEGLVLDGLTPIVADDQEAGGARDNVFRLEPLTAGG